MLTEDSIVAVSEGLAAADLGGETVLLDVNAGTYFGLDEVGARIFELVQEPTGVRAIVATLLEEYDVEERVLTEDVLAFLRKLEAKRLVEVRNGKAA